MGYEEDRVSSQKAFVEDYFHNLKLIGIVIPEDKFEEAERMERQRFNLCRDVAEAAGREELRRQIREVISR